MKDFSPIRESNIDEPQNFGAVNNSGFKMTFPNGWTVSVMWGVGNYCSNRDPYGDYHEPRKYAEYQSASAEIIAWHSSGADWVFIDNQTSLGWLSPTQILAIINKIQEAE